MDKPPSFDTAISPIQLVLFEATQNIKYLTAIIIHIKATKAVGIKVQQKYFLRCTL